MAQPFWYCCSHTDRTVLNSPAWEAGEFLLSARKAARLALDERGAAGRGHGRQPGGVWPVCTREGAGLGRALRVTVSGPLCIACGVCERVAPDLFTVVGHRVAVPSAPVFAAEWTELAYAAAEDCPTAAIDLIPVIPIRGRLLKVKGEA